MSYHNIIKEINIVSNYLYKSERLTKCNSDLTKINKIRQDLNIAINKKSVEYNSYSLSKIQREAIKLFYQIEGKRKYNACR